MFDFPKPSALIRYLFSFSINNDDAQNGLVLDFLAGSRTTAHAVLDLNALDGGNRRFILVQLPEPTRTRRTNGDWEESVAWKAGYSTITEIAKERFVA